MTFDSIVRKALTGAGIAVAFVALEHGVFAQDESISTAAACPVAALQSSHFSGKVTVVSDGDTIKVAAEFGKTVAIRLLTMDTPETHYQGLTQGYWGDRAAERMAELLPIGSQVTVELDQERCDTYGRVLGYIFRGSQFINEQMLEEGLAVNYCIYPNVKYCDRFAPIVQKQIDRHAGMFSDAKLLLPYDFRRIEGNRPYEKFAGSIRTKQVLSPNQVGKIPVADRIFFINKNDIRAPYRLAN